MGDVQEARDFPRVAAPTTGVSWAHALRAALQRVSAVEDFRRCGQQWRDAGVTVVVAPTGETRRHGIHSCGSCWLCPVCWSRRRIQERAEIVWAGEQWYAAGGGIGRVTVTVPHEAGEPLDAVWIRLNDVSTVLRSGRARATLRDDFGLVHLIRATEITHGPHGWHPHEHWLAFTREPWDEPTRAGLWRWIRDRWRRRDTANPRSPLYQPEKRYRPQDPQTVDPADLERTAGHITKGGSRSTEDRYWRAVEAGNDDLAAYLAPFAFGEDAANGDPDAVALWREYEATTRNRVWIQWSNGSRPVFGLGPAGREPALEGAAIYLSKGGRMGRGAGG